MLYNRKLTDASSPIGALAIDRKDIPVMAIFASKSPKTFLLVKHCGFVAILDTDLDSGVLWNFSIWLWRDFVHPLVDCICLVIPFSKHFWHLATSFFLSSQKNPCQTVDFLFFS